MGQLVLFINRIHKYYSFSKLLKHLKAALQLRWQACRKSQLLGKISGHIDIKLAERNTQVLSKTESFSLPCTCRINTVCRIGRVHYCLLVVLAINLDNSRGLRELYYYSEAQESCPPLDKPVNLSNLSGKRFWVKIEKEMTQTGQSSHSPHLTPLYSSIVCYSSKR